MFLWQFYVFEVQFDKSTQKQCRKNEKKKIQIKFTYDILILLLFFIPSNCEIIFTHFKNRPRKVVMVSKSILLI